MYSECPHTGGKLQPIFGGQADRSAEGVIYVRNARPLDYGEDYFMTEYARQYGRTYLDDEANLRALAQKRLHHIRRWSPGGQLFEIGAACGFFLDEARKSGFSVSGLEISPYAASVARGMGLDVRQAAFPGEDLPSELSAVCAFYVIEHIENQKAVFQTIARMLTRGGIFAFALPSTFGPVMRYNPEQWLQTHPADHFADYSPQSIKRVLALYGMKLVHVRPASYHPARAKGMLRNPWIFKRYADFFAFGDTMEGIAVRI